MNTDNDGQNNADVPLNDKQITKHSLIPQGHSIDIPTNE